MLSWERQRRLHDRLKYLIELEKVRNFSWDNWRKRVSLSIKTDLAHELTPIVLTF
jgi:hypothetical protein